MPWRHDGDDESWSHRRYGHEHRLRDWSEEDRLMHEVEQATGRSAVTPSPRRPGARRLGHLSLGQGAWTSRDQLHREVTPRRQVRADRELERALVDGRARLVTPLGHAVACALQEVSALRGAVIDVREHEGDVTLVGVVKSARQRELAAQCAGQVPGVALVRCRLRVR